MQTIPSLHDDAFMIACVNESKYTAVHLVVKRDLRNFGLV